MTNTPIYVPSKGRPNNLTSKLLSNEGIDHIIVVEPQDYASYKAVLLPHTKLMMLPLDNQGCGYVRNYIIKYATENMLENNPGIFMLDDDLVSLSKLAIAPPNKKGNVYARPVKTAKLSDIFNEWAADAIESGVSYSSIGMAGFAHSYNLETHFNGNGESKSVGYGFVWVNVTDLNNVGYRSVMCHEDADCLIRLLLSGKVASRSWKFSYITAPQASPTTHPGGCASIYAQSLVIRHTLVDNLATDLDVITEKIVDKLSPQAKKDWGNRTVYKKGLLLKKRPDAGPGILPDFKNIARLVKLKSESV